MNGEPAKLHELVEAVLRAGHLCANSCYNLARQDEPLTPRQQDVLRESAEAWDAAVALLRRWKPGGPGAR